MQGRRGEFSPTFEERVTADEQKAFRFVSHLSCPIEQASADDYQQYWVQERVLMKLERCA
jgi:hypothetical protein